MASSPHHPLHRRTATFRRRTSTTRPSPAPAHRGRTTRRCWRPGGRRLRTLTAAIDHDLDRHGVHFGGAEAPDTLHVDAVPRLLAADEWRLLAAGLAQRASAERLRGRRVRAAGGRRRRRPPGPRARHGATVRAAGGRASPRPRPAGARRGPRRGAGAQRCLPRARRQHALAVGARLLGGRPDRSGGVPAAPAAGGRGRSGRGPWPRWVARWPPQPRPGEEPAPVLVSDGETDAAFFEHRALAEALDLPLVTPDGLRARRGRLWARVEGERRPQRVNVVYRRTDENA